MQTIITILELTFIFVFTTSNICAQISSGGKPYSFKHLVEKSSQIKEMDRFDLESLLKEDKNTPEDLPYRFGYGFDVDYNLKNSGNWINLADGGKLWRLQIKSEGAYSINLIYDKFWLPTGAEFFIYNSDKSMVIGAFTARNNKQHGKFATGLVKGAEIILEYFEPADVKRVGEISISRIVHAYRNLFNFDDLKLGKTIGFGSSKSCNNNVYCPEALGWEDEVHSVGMIVLGDGTRLCTGSLINNKKENYAPYFLTANHCLRGDLNTWVIWFNYESSTCLNPSSEPSFQTITGTTLKANNLASDFALLLLDATPPLGYDVYYSGWSNINTPPSSSVVIHHPSGDIKKISYDDDSAVSSDFDPDPYLADSHWEVVFDDGTTETGSSGAPLFDQNHRIVGNNHGGTGSPYCTKRKKWYGKFSMSWNYGSNYSSRLKDWLDPNNSGVTTLNGLEDGMLASGTLPASATWSGSHTLSGNILVPSNTYLLIEYGTTINFNNYNITTTGTGKIHVEQGVTENFAKLKLWDDDDYIIGLFPTIQQAADHAPGNTASTIELFSKTYSGNVSITKDQITLKTKNPNQGNATINGNITVTNCDLIVLDYLTMDKWKTISMSGGWANYVRFCKVKDSYTSSNKINMYNCNNSSVYETNCTFNFSNTHAAYLYNTSLGSFEGNVLTGNVIAVQASNNSFANAYGNNFCTNYGLDINALSGSSVEAYGNTWSRPFPSSIGGNVYGGSHHTCSTQMSKGNGIFGSTDDEPISKEIIEVDKNHLELLGRIDEENEEKTPDVMDNYKSDFDELIYRYKILLNEKSDGVETTAILSKIEKCYYATEDEDDFEAYIKTLLSDKRYQEVYPYIERYYANLHLTRDEYKEAIEVCEKVLSSKGINETLTCEMLYEEGLIYKYSLDDTEAALELFTEIVEKYPQSNLSSFAIRELEMEGKEVPQNDNEKGKIVENNLNNYMIESYPNPFNPTTTLSYSLPTASDVKLEIYDVMGRMIKSFAANSQASGTHQVIWDGTNSNGARVATGIYIYRFEAVSLETNEHFLKSEKLMMVK